MRNKAARAKFLPDGKTHKGVKISYHSLPCLIRDI